MSTTAEPNTRTAGRTRWAGWPLERVLFALAGSVAIASALLAALVSPWWLLLTAFIGLNQLLFAAVGDCLAATILRRALGFKPAVGR